MENTSLFYFISVTFQVPSHLPASVWMSLIIQAAFFLFAPHQSLLMKHQPASLNFSSRQWAAGESAGSQSQLCTIFADSPWPNGFIWVCFPVWRRGLSTAPWGGGSAILTILSSMLYHMVVTVSESGHSPDSYGALLAAGEGGVNTIWNHKWSSVKEMCMVHECVVRNGFIW